MAICCYAVVLPWQKWSIVVPFIFYAGCLPWVCTADRDSETTKDETPGLKGSGRPTLGLNAMSGPPGKGKNEDEEFDYDADYDNETEGAPPSKSPIIRKSARDLDEEEDDGLESPGRQVEVDPDEDEEDRSPDAASVEKFEADERHGRKPDEQDLEVLDEVSGAEPGQQTSPAEMDHFETRAQKGVKQLDEEDQDVIDAVSEDPDDELPASREEPRATGSTGVSKPELPGEMMPRGRAVGILEEPQAGTGFSSVPKDPKLAYNRVKQMGKQHEETITRMSPILGRISGNVGKALEMADKYGKQANLLAKGVQKFSSTAWPTFRKQVNRDHDGHAHTMLTKFDEAAPPPPVSDEARKALSKIRSKFGHPEGAAHLHGEDDALKQLRVRAGSFLQERTSWQRRSEQRSLEMAGSGVWRGPSNSSVK